MSIHIYDPACPVTSQSPCTCYAIASVVPSHATKFSAHLLHCALSAPSPDQVPPVVYLPSDLTQPVNELEFRSYLKIHQLQAPLNSDHSVTTTLPVDLKSFETRWQTRVSQRPAALCWPAICSACDKDPTSKDSLLRCHDCGLSIHASCRGRSVDPKMFTNRYYLCESCTFCNFCHRKDNEHLTKICDVCTGTWHVYCMQLPHSKIIPLSQTASRMFRCKRCTDAGSRKLVESEVVQTSTNHMSDSIPQIDFLNAEIEMDSDDATEDQAETSSEDD